MFTKFAAALVFASIAFPTFSMADSSISTNPGQRYITVQTYWSDMSESERQKMVALGVAAMKSEIAAKVPLLKNPTLSNALLSPAFVNELTTELRRYLDDTDALVGSKHSLVRKAANALPRAILFTVGVSGGLHWMLGGKASMDMGLVVMFPSFQTVIDTAQRDAQNQPLVLEEDKFKLFDAAIVGVPHGYAGVGVGGGATFSIGAAGIWGKMSSAQDFHGVVVAGSAGFTVPLSVIPFLNLLPFPDGGDIDIGVVANADHVFALARLSADKGAEAAATADFEGGDIIPWQSLIAPLADTKSWVRSVLSAVGFKPDSNDEKTDVDTKTTDDPGKDKGDSGKVDSGKDGGIS